jgi:hypothetical protein
VSARVTHTRAAPGVCQCQPGQWWPARARARELAGARARQEGGQVTGGTGQTSSNLLQRVPHMETNTPQGLAKCAVASARPCSPLHPYTPVHTQPGSIHICCCVLHSQAAIHPPLPPGPPNLFFSSWFARVRQHTPGGNACAQSWAAFHAHGG